MSSELGPSAAVSALLVLETSASCGCSDAPHAPKDSANNAVTRSRDLGAFMFRAPLGYDSPRRIAWGSSPNRVGSGQDWVEVEAAEVE